MPGLRYANLVDKPITVLDMTSLTTDEFAILVPALEAAFQAHMTEWRLDGKPRVARRYATYVNCPLPTPEDRLLFILVYLKTNPLQVAHGLLFGLPQGKANQWIHVLLPVLRNAFRSLGDAPSRSIEELKQRLACDTSAIATLNENTTPLFAMMEPNDESRVPKMMLNRRVAIAARRGITH